MKLGPFSWLLFVAFWALAPIAGETAFAQQSSYENGVTFGVGQLRRFAAPNPETCIASCQQDRRCRAWTFQRAESDSAGRSYCHLHQGVFERSANGCCISGVIHQRAGAYPDRPPGYTPPYQQRWQSTLVDGLTFGVGNYRYFDIPGQDSGYCRDACGSDAQCRAWTYQRAQYNDRGAPVCHLHGWIGERSANPCCVSGVVRRW